MKGITDMAHEPLDGHNAGEAAPAPARAMTVRGAAFLGVGSMVGAGIFALLGEAGAVAGSAVWLSFLLAGVVATLQGYAVAKLGARYPSSGGIVTFLLQGYGRGHITAITSWLLYFAAIIVTAMVSVSFGSYGAALFFDDSTGWSKILTSGVIVLVAAVNIIGTKLIDRVQTAIVIVLLVVFAVFVVVTLAQFDPSLLATSTYPPTMDIVGSVALTFFAYLGFTVISFTGGDLPNPRRNLPRAMYLALGITITLYVLISLGVFGTLTVQEVIDNGETALAVAAQPALGEAGFAIMALAALLATASSVNANVYAAVGSTAKLAESGTFPPIFGNPSWTGGTRGLTISVMLILLLANLVDLTAIASLGSAVALAIFLVTSIAAYRLRHETASRASIIIAAIALTIVVLVVFAVQTLTTSPETFAAMIGIVALAVALEMSWSTVRARRASRT
ncbi:APC family permease [Rhodococcus globerulus]|uniref:APC family permease n=1 Tax=Rhodococcus globerulus TaxID=33008 RepID=A0ABU4C370_RHOGO|nr:APC family permease [Rhodococcus globerulus]MDV6270955.1 APC family permease [Rhodococcus globerulus]